MFPILLFLAASVFVAPQRSSPDARSLLTERPADVELARLRRSLSTPSAQALAFELELPDGKRLAMRLERRSSTRPEATTSSWTGLATLPDDPAGYGAFVRKADAFVGTVLHDGKLLRVTPVDGGFRLTEATERPGPCATPDEPVDLSQAATTESGTTPSRAVTPGPLQPTFSTKSPSRQGDTDVDVLVCWTDEAAVAAGGDDTIQALIDLAALETNLAFDRSEVDLFVRVVHVHKVTYTESGSMATDLARLRLQVDGFMDEVHALRDVHGADVVSLFVADDSACGRSYNLGSPPSAAFAPFAFHLVSQGCATGYYAFGHELGHNLGLNHDRANATGVPSYPYAYGYWTPNQVYRTIMALERPAAFGMRIPYFSNPDVTFQGMPLGTPLGELLESHCALALNNNASIASAWRPTQVP